MNQIGFVFLIKIFQSVFPHIILTSFDQKLSVRLKVSVQFGATHNVGIDNFLDKEF